MKKFLISISLIFAFISISAGQENPVVLLEEIIPKEFVYREFFVKNPMWSNSSFTIENLQHFKGKILHTHIVRYELREDGTKVYGDCDGYPTKNIYIIFDEEGFIKYSCEIQTQSGWDSEKKWLVYTEYKFKDGLYQIIEHTPNSKTGLYTQKYLVKKAQDGSVHFYSVRKNDVIADEPTYVFAAEGSDLVFEDHFFYRQDKKIIFTNEYMKTNSDRKINTPRMEISRNPLGFVEHYSVHPAENGKPGDYCESFTELIDSPDELLLSSFPDFFN